MANRAVCELSSESAHTFDDRAPTDTRDALLLRRMQSGTPTEDLHTSGMCTSGNPSLLGSLLSDENAFGNAENCWRTAAQEEIMRLKAQVSR